DLAAAAAVLCELEWRRQTDQGQSKKNWASQVALVVKNPLANAGDMRCQFSPWVGKILWRMA
ncbi:hypothetical protein, partial [Glaesserella parasuis]|uniref:hypothetical protein n=1 Tax=Glaesserella parasuis TaxID=738 RepID=UPI003B66C9C8